MIDLINIKSKCQLFFYNNALYMALSVLKKSTITFFKNCDIFILLIVYIKTFDDSINY